MRTVRLIAAIMIASTAVHNVPAEAAKPSKPEQRERCEKAKKAGNYNTPDGRATAKVHYNPNLPFHKAFWGEPARQQKCLAKTGHLCPN
ncbi:hypothetical protein [Breoghania sp.]|uniref:hypothetical protein n=1 Tax=Breoghania sp. TaxID=2065378 RepID=UPI00262ECC9D|nr:hypothetical protein [Breoghania sp.]MDJ0931450.1 hypothetical protein [Breoghania sp.]